MILPKGIWRRYRVQFSSVLWPEKCLPYFSGPKSYPQLRTFKGYRTTVRGSENGTIFLDTFLHFFASKSQFFSCRTSSHVSWIVIIRWRLRAPCLQVLSSISHLLNQQTIELLKSTVSKNMSCSQHRSEFLPKQKSDHDTNQSPDCAGRDLGLVSVYL